MKVLVLWADDRSANYGVRVLAEGAGHLSREAWGDDIEIQWQDFGRPGLPGSFGVRAIVRDMLSFGRSGPIRSVLRCADIVVDTGAGDSFSDIYGLKRLFVMVYVQLRCIFLGKPLVLFPQTIGPFHTRIGALAAGAVLERAACVIAREPHSADVAVQNRAQEVLT